ncbi:FecR domain-containing protein [Butyricimonas synergistica]|uniref:FecR domain-containing protein n=1 Tax=Butyricimonas synergistica TaxID=544644 RepID=UPI0003730FE5|nr:FecR domain-containing protein [Butyricimonas synergistica]
MKISDRIYELISGKLNDALSAEEERELAGWLEADGEHEVIFEEMRKLHTQAKLLRREFTPDVEGTLRKLKGHGRKQVGMRVWWKYAAMFILPLGIALVLWQGLKEEREKQHRQFSTVARPGSERAVLRLFDGQTVVLDSTSGSTLLAKSGNVRVEVDSNRLLRYSPEDTVTGSREMKNNELIVPRGGEYQIELADGTRVWLNSATKLIFPRNFTGGERRVVLSGEAFFEVARDESKPFIVETSRMDVKVLGTRFNVNAYADNDEVSATLVNGSVEVSSGKQKPMVLVPGEQAYGNAGELEKREVNVRLYTSWIDGRFLFNNAELEEIAKQVSRWYDVKIFFANESVKKIRFTGGMVKFKPLDDLIRMIESTSPVRFSVKGKTIVISEE